MDAVYEQVELALDEAQAIVFASLKDPDPKVRLDAAALMLRHNNAARRRGWSRGRGGADEPEPVTIKWIEPGQGRG
jgi:hypothetical protein